MQNKEISYEHSSFNHAGGWRHRQLGGVSRVESSCHAGMVLTGASIVPHRGAFRTIRQEVRPIDPGDDTGTPVSEDYPVPFRFTGGLNRVLIGLSDSQLTAVDEEEIPRAKAAINVSQ
jgi:hypothetical protein